MRKSSFYILLLVVTTIAIAQISVHAQSASDMAKKLETLRAYPDVMVVNGKISTLDGANQQVEAMAIRDHRILAMGTTADIRSLAGPKTEIIDAKGRRAFPP